MSISKLWKHSNQALPYLIKKLIKKFVRLNQIQKSRATLHFGLMLDGIYKHLEAYSGEAVYDQNR